MAEAVEMEVETLDGANNGGDAEQATQNPSSSSSGSDSEEDEDEELKLETIEKELAENPLSYDAHVQYIKSLRKLGHIEKLRQARESMNALFPLSPTMWQEWAKDEASLSTGSESLAATEKLYEQGVQEYLSVPLWCDYINFVQEHDQSVAQLAPDGILKMRDLFERALTAAGVHIVNGSKIWEAYREFEQAIFVTIDDSDNEEKERQVHLIRSLFHRQLSVPLADSKSTVLAYKLWETEQGNVNDVNSDDLDGVPSHVTSAYQKAVQMYNARVNYEDQLCNPDASDVDKLQQFMNYIKFEESSGDPARVQILYERAVAEFPVSSDLWLRYTHYLDKTLKVPNVLRGVYSRATRNCPWIGELWVRYMLSLERVGAPEKELSAVFEQSLRSTFLSLEEYMDVFLTRIDGLRRRISLASAMEDDLDYRVIRETFQHATDFLSPHLKNTDNLLRMHAYWARLESSLGKDLTAARGVWESLIKTSGSMFEVWQGYIAMEIELGHINEARSIYKRCYSKRFLRTGSEVLPRLEELKLFRSQQESKNTAASAFPKENPPAKNASQKRKTATRSTEEQPPPKRQKDTTKKMEVVRNNAGQKDTVQKSSEKNNAGSINISEGANLPGAADPVTTNEKVVGDSPSKEAKPSFYTDQCTVFISNISLQAKEEHLREFFGDSGGVTAIRLLKDKFTGKSRGLAYVDFSDDAHLEAAVAKNRQKLLGEKLSIARSDPKQSRKRASSGSSAARGQGRRVASGSDHNNTAEEPAEGSKESVPRNTTSSVSHRRGGHVQLVGKNTFALPRTLARPLGWGKSELKNEGDDKPKSNDEFRNMLLKK
ncbi:uncharacterized protein LOC131236659 isoform X2 [Magnolia sinica]|uniref:uncharacterized protein LOC131236659 isoform X2 n=1 Tax=Magnolia sinica TaxID=86752 RepID=UPI00265B2FFC|nr:uncharacterized protein LOC131236659 isoform X2 [Magnolia sinica]